MAKFLLLLLAWSGSGFAQDPSWGAVLGRLFGEGRVCKRKGITQPVFETTTNGYTLRL